MKRHEDQADRIDQSSPAFARTSSIMASIALILASNYGIRVTVVDCTPQVRHDNLGDSAVATEWWIRLPRCGLRASIALSNAAIASEASSVFSKAQPTALREKASRMTAR